MPEAARETRSHPHPNPFPSRERGLEERGYGAKEIAAALGIHRVNVSRRADKEDWPFREEGSNGGRRKVYPLAGLPPEVCRAVEGWKLKKVVSGQGLVVSEEQIPPSPPLSKGGELKVGEARVLAAWQQNKALAEADLLRLYLEEAGRAAYGAVVAAKVAFITAYNEGARGPYPKLFERLGPVTMKTVERWAVKAKKAPGGDIVTALASRHGDHLRGQRRLWGRQGKADDLLETPQGQILLAQALSLNRKPLREAVKVAKEVMEARGLECRASDSVMVQVLEDYRARHYDQWVFYRQGEKSLNDECVPYLIRDPEKLRVGDCLVADGHTFNFELVNPWDGKPKRMTLILFYEMRSNFPLGWEIMPTENTQAIAAALRRAILRLGMLPLCAYLDNGRAFGAKHFTGDLAQSGLVGLFERLHIKTIFAKPYHAQSKTVERFFGNFAELERCFPSYTGTSIEQKPARLQRNEKLHQRIHQKLTGGYVPSIEDAHRLIAAWFDKYAARGNTRSRYLAGKCPREIFEAGAGPGVDEGRLVELMMTEENRSISRGEIKLPAPAGSIYAAGDGSIHYRASGSELYGRKHQALVRYDLQDRSRILVYESTGEFICEARPDKMVHPIAKVTGTDEDREELKAQLTHQKRLIKGTLATARAFTATTIVPETRRLLESQGLAGDGSGTRVQKAKVLPLSAGDLEQIQQEFEADQARGDTVLETAAPAALELPGTLDEADLLFRQLRRLPDGERYERLLELEVQNYALPRDDVRFLRMFELTGQYAANREFYEVRRMQMMDGGQIKKQGEVNG